MYHSVQPHALTGFLCPPYRASLQEAQPELSMCCDTKFGMLLNSVPSIAPCYLLLHSKMLLTVMHDHMRLQDAGYSQD